jgi:UDP-glucose 4-epimerase
MGIKKVLVTGSTGFIGSSIAIKLEKDYKVIKTSRTQIQANGKDVLYLDLSKPETIYGLHQTHRFDVVVHFGAQIGWTDKDEKTMLMSNVVSTSLLAMEAEQMGAKFIFASAAIVHGAYAENININSEINLDTFYAKSKWFAEELIRMSGVNYCILRIGGVFGLNGPSHLGLNRVITDVLNQVSPKLYSKSDAQRNYIYVWDVASSVEYAINHDIQGVHLLAGSESITIRAMMEQVCHTLGIKKNKQSYSKVKNQLIKPSESFPSARNFEAALQDIKLRAGTK